MNRLCECPGCLKPAVKDSRYCSKTCRRTASRYFTRKVAPLRAALAELGEAERNRPPAMRFRLEVEEIFAEDGARYQVGTDPHRHPEARSKEKAA